MADASAAVSVSVHVNEAEAPGARLATDAGVTGLHVAGPMLSLTVTSVSVMFPVFVATYGRHRRGDTDLDLRRPAAFVSADGGTCATTVASSSAVTFSPVGSMPDASALFVTGTGGLRTAVRCGCR